ncbi:hypothetical protein [Spirillospora sp. CA-128828]|uniref:hypothetical protein n=1 Tax=Spirillospora sp. CA-128828 TaxID=3240033 RepID=UPI003D9337AF
MVANAPLRGRPRSAPPAPRRGFVLAFALMLGAGAAVVLTATAGRAAAPAGRSPRT